MPDNLAPLSAIGVLLAGTPAVVFWHFALWDDTAAPSPYDAGNAYAGEQAHVRIQRVCGEEGIPFSSAASTSLVCGPQPIAAPFAIMQDAEKVDHGVLT